MIVFPSLLYGRQFHENGAFPSVYYYIFRYVLNELVETERIYVQDLASVVDGYIGNLSSMELPEDLQGKDKIIFANIAQILDFHKTCVEIYGPSLTTKNICVYCI